MSSIRFTIIGFCMAAFPFASLGQRAAAPARDSMTLEGFISENKTLTPNKVYIVKYNVKVGKNAVLTVNAGTKVVFDAGTSLVVEGGLNIEGAPNNFAEFTSRNLYAAGNGILIRGGQGSDIRIRYAYFSQLNVPLRFESEWSRKNVIIEKNVFTELKTGESNILITTPLVDYQPGADNSVNFSFSQNAFHDNWGSIFIENFEDNFMKLKFDNNLITNNVVYGIDIGIPSNTPVFGLFDDQKAEYKMEMQGNSIFGNYQINSATDTIIREISVGIQGDGERFSIPGNFFRSKSPDYVSSTFDHFYQNSRLPLLEAQPVLDKPLETAPPHIWKVKINGEEVKNYDDLPRHIDPRNVTFEVHFNKPVTAFDKTQLESVTFDTLAEKIKKLPITISQTSWSADKTVFTFTVSNASFIRDLYAFVVLTNFKDAEGFVVPNFSIGQRNAINKYRRLQLTGGIRSADLISAKKGMINVDAEGNIFLPTEKSVKTLETLSDIGVLKNLGPYRSLTKTWELGLMAGACNYMGSLTYKLADKDEYNFSIGIFGQYNLNKWVSFRALFWYGKISGTDIGDKDPDRAMRNLNFKNHIVEGSITAHWHLLKYGTSRGEKFTPTLFAGVGIFRNNPMAQIYLYSNDKDEPVYLTYKDGQFLTDGTGDAVWVPLRPIGIEGQTVKGIDPEGGDLSRSPDKALFADRYAPRQFKKVQVSFPVGISLDYIIYNKWVLSAELGVRLTTTRYLDGHGGYYWDRGHEYDERGGFLYDPVTGIPINAHQSIIDANPEIWGKVKGDKVLLPTTITVTDPYIRSDDGRYISYTTEYPTAALLANPSLVNIDQGIVDSSSLSRNPNSGYNDAFTIPNARKVNPKAFDHFGFVGVKVSKVLGQTDKKKSSRYKTKEKYRARDSDNDGASDEEEKLIGTNVRNPDTDGDGLIDGEEVRLKTDPLKTDTDGDGLTDYKETTAHATNPLKKDTDGDGLDDGAEVSLHKTNPDNIDTDGDGNSDGKEVNELKTDPLKADNE